jgi:hypothetical protein
LRIQGVLNSGSKWEVEAGLIKNVDYVLDICGRDLIGRMEEKCFPREQFTICNSMEAGR